MKSVRLALDIHIAEKRYRARTVLRDVDIGLRQGEVVSLIGASGCGKSSLLSIASGLDRDFQGGIKLHGQPLDGVHRDIGFIFQEPRLFPWLTVAQNVAFDSDNDAAAQKLSTRLLTEVGLHEQAQSLPSSCPAARRNGPRSRAGYSAIQGYCCSMNRFPPSTPSRA